jgi:hypothetical protein
MRFLRFLAVVLATVSFISGGQCEEPVPKGGDSPGAGLATRSVSLYLGLERSLEIAIAQGDRGAASALLDEGFRFSSGKDEAIGRKQWLDREIAAKRGPALVRDLNVREAASVAIVNFLLDYRRDGGKGIVFSVTDTWNSVTHQLQSRREVELKSPPPPFDRPSGRE